VEKGRNIYQKSCIVVVNRKIKSERVFECGNRRITDNEKSTMGKGMFSVMAWTFPFLDIRIIEEQFAGIDKMYYRKSPALCKAFEV